MGVTIVDAGPQSVHRDARAIGYTAFGWVVVFSAFHVYWYAGGTFGLGGPLPRSPHSLAGLAFEVVVIGAFPIGALVCLAAAGGWARGSLRWLIVPVVWFGWALLILRGAAGVLDDLTRVTGLLPTGITGLTVEQAMGTARPSVALRYSGYATDAYFLLGGVLFGILGLRLRRLRPAGQSPVVASSPPRTH